MAQEHISLRDACALFPGRPHVNTVRRWATRGLYGTKLRTQRFGGKRLTRKDWVADFSKQMVAASPDPLAGAPVADSAAVAAEEKLDALGIR